MAELSLAALRFSRNDVFEKIFKIHIKQRNKSAEKCGCYSLACQSQIQSDIYQSHSILMVNQTIFCLNKTPQNGSGTFTCKLAYRGYPEDISARVHGNVFWEGDDVKRRINAIAAWLSHGFIIHNEGGC